MDKFVHYLQTDRVKATDFIYITAQKKEAIIFFNLKNNNLKKKAVNCYYFSQLTLSGIKICLNCA
ncbi:hypothetical protein D5085_09170 [Ectothiorhodospiraceae bacterium BW-2]|nr:hypothetical protein D5085_09170 [Ectothiorhodospiraceae bacterium BW-2]